MARVKKETEPQIADEVLDPLTEIANLIPEPIPVVETPAPKVFCVLDDHPVNSTLVILQWPGEPAVPWLQTPNGKMDVPQGDLAWKLPLNADIKRTGIHTFVATQREAVVFLPNLVCATAVEACQGFKKHFHGERE